MERLDRVLASSMAVSSWPGAQVHHLSDLGSDHRIILLQLHPMAAKTKANFHFDSRWIGNEEANQILQAQWLSPVSGTFQYQLHETLKLTRHELYKWAASGTSNSARQIRELQDAISVARDQTMIDWAGIVSLEQQLSEAYLQEEIYWEQKSRTHWLTWGDSNTRFFHLTTLQKRRRNRILLLRDDVGGIHTDEDAKGTVAVAHFGNLFASEALEELSFVASLNLPVLVTDSMNSALITTVTREEIKAAVFSIGGYQAPGSDGFTGIFFQTYWGLVGDLVTSVVLEFFNSGHLLPNFNHTWITLLPKVPNAEMMRQMRPIGLCQVPYKIISKVLTSRLRDVLPRIVSPCQNGFVKGRLITDNVLIGQEVLHFLKTKTSGHKKWMALKLDMEKAYDRVEWEFLFGVMRHLGFCERWLSWLWACVTSVSYSVLFNGAPHGYFKPHRGIRQGDPLSPLLFALYTEAFTCCINRAVAMGFLHGLKINRFCPPISHLLFADDSYIFLRASSTECHHLLQLLHEYQQASGQKVNLQKSTVSFSANVAERGGFSDFHSWGPIPNNFFKSNKK
ncbi:unnamed protein product [Linum trigynum]|uniref:Reverse transcriptase domain-containing protein n=1 Tax=Linum trigynum TaxID=586398 RepID=A0AAV2FGF2_9ROSI